MALFTPIETVKDIMSTQNAKFWRVSDPQGGLIASHYVVDSTLSDSYTGLSKLLDDLSGDYVIVKLFKQVPKKNGSSEGQQMFTYNVRLANSSSNNNNNRQPAQIQGFSPEYVDMKINMMKLEMENERLRKEAESPKTVDGVNYEQEIFGMLKGFFMKSQVSGMTPAPAQKEIASTEQQNPPVEPGVIATMAKNVKAVMNGQTMDLFESLSYFAENDPATFKSQATMIIDSVKAYKATLNQASE
jgi:hypothetical protein